MRFVTREYYLADTINALARINMHAMNTENDMRIILMLMNRGLVANGRMGSLWLIDPIHPIPPTRVVELDNFYA